MSPSFIFLNYGSEYRLRNYYGRRYDSRDNVIDWDYHMALREQTTIVHSKEYAKWRQTGVAFEVRDCNYTHPNRTMATVDGLKQASSFCLSER